MVEVSPIAVRPEAAIEYLRRKVGIPTERWTDLWQEMHGAGFMVAGATKTGLIEDFHAAVTEALAEGRTEDWFLEQFDTIVARHGWSHNGERRWRSRIIYRTNIRSARAAGEWKQIQAIKHRRPWLRYVTMHDDRVRHQHLDWHDLVLHVDDPWWETHFPPNGWGCRCRVESLNDRGLRRLGLTPAAKAPEVELVPRIINQTTEPTTVMVPKGIDPGFAWNPGVAGFGRGANARAVDAHSGWKELHAPGVPSTRELPRLHIDEVTLPRAEPAQSEAEVYQRFREAIGGDEAVWRDATGAPVRIGLRIVEHMMERDKRLDGRDRFFPLMRGLVEQPAEIWVGFASEPGTGVVRLRRRYVRLVRIQRNRVIGLVADTDAGEWSGLSFFRGGLTSQNRLRSGVLVYRKDPA